MSDAFLRQFYSRVAPLVPIANRLRLALRAKDESGAKADAAAVMGFCESLRDEREACVYFDQQWDEWNFAIGAWAHGGRNGDEPQQPNWPSRLPRTHKAIDVIKAVIWVFNAAGTTVRLIEHKIDGMFDDDILGTVLRRLIMALDDLQEIIDRSEEVADDGRIDRNQVAVLLGFSAAHLKNHPELLPNVVARDEKSVPIYQYSQVREKFISSGNSRSNRLPESFNEAIKRIGESVQ